MQLSLKRKLDTWAGLPLLSLLNAVTGIVGRVLKRSHAVLPVRSILVMKFQGMGSLAIAAPALYALRKAHPQARISFWGSAETAALARRLGGIFDEVFVLDESSIIRFAASSFRCLTKILRERFDWAFDLEVYSKLSSVLLTFTCARNRAGFAVESVRLRKGCHTHLLFFNRTRYLGEAYERLLALCHVSPVAALAPDDPSLPSLFSFPIAAHPIAGRRYGVLHLPVGELSTERAWPIEKAVEFAKKVLSEGEGEIALTGKGAFDREWVGKFLEAFPDEGRIHSFVDRLSIDGLLSALALADWVVSPDTGVLHLARLTRSREGGSPIPVVGLFGPTRGATYFGEATPFGKAVEIDYYCSPCVHYWAAPPCGGENQCMKGIGSDAVWMALRSILDSPSLEPAKKSRDQGVREASYVPGLVYSRP